MKTHTDNTTGSKLKSLHKAASGESGPTSKLYAQLFYCWTFLGVIFLAIYSVQGIQNESQTLIGLMATWLLWMTGSYLLSLLGTYSPNSPQISSRNELTADQQAADQQAADQQAADQQAADQQANEEVLLDDESIPNVADSPVWNNAPDAEFSDELDIDSIYAYLAAEPVKAESPEWELRLIWHSSGDKKAVHNVLISNMNGEQANKILEDAQSGEATLGVFGPANVLQKLARDLKGVGMDADLYPAS